MRILTGTCVALLALTLVAPAVAGELTIGTNIGTGNLYPFGKVAGTEPGTRYQQVYDNGQFGGPISITGIMFFHLRGTTFRDADYEVHLSTSANPVNGLSFTFADNVGVDDQLFASFGLSGAADDVTITGTPFSYDPADGDLLVDMIITNASGNQFTYFESMSSTSGGLFSRMHNFNGGYENYGLVTKFTYGRIVPVPPAAALGFALLGGLVLLRRLRRRN